MPGKKSVVLFKAICVILTASMILNEVAFALDEVRVCLAAPGLFSRMGNVKYDSGLGQYVLDAPGAENGAPFLWHAIARALYHGLDETQLRHYIGEILVKRFGEDGFGPFDVGSVEFRDREFVLKRKDHYAEYYFTADVAGKNFPYYVDVAPDEHIGVRVVNTHEPEESIFVRYPKLDEPYMPKVAEEIIEKKLRIALELNRVWEKSPDKRALDLMSGRFSYITESTGAKEVIGIGLNGEELSGNARLTDHKVQDLNGNPDIPYPDGYFDAVVIISGLAYAEDPVELLRAAARKLKPGGLLFIAYDEAGYEIEDASDLWKGTPPGDRREVVRNIVFETRLFRAVDTDLKEYIFMGDKRRLVFITAERTEEMVLPETPLQPVAPKPELAFGYKAGGLALGTIVGAVRLWGSMGPAGIFVSLGISFAAFLVGWGAHEFGHGLARMLGQSYQEEVRAGPLASLILLITSAACMVSPAHSVLFHTVSTIAFFNYLVHIFADRQALFREDGPAAVGGLLKGAIFAVTLAWGIITLPDAVRPWAAPVLALVILRFIGLRFQAALAGVASSESDMYGVPDSDNKGNNVVYMSKKRDGKNRKKRRERNKQRRAREAAKPKERVVRLKDGTTLHRPAEKPRKEKPAPQAAEPVKPREEPPAESPAEQPPRLMEHETYMLQELEEVIGRASETARSRGTRAVDVRDDLLRRIGAGDSSKIRERASLVGFSLLSERVKECPSLGAQSPEEVKERPFFILFYPAVISDIANKGLPYNVFSLAGGMAEEGINVVLVPVPERYGTYSGTGVVNDNGIDKAHPILYDWVNLVIDRYMDVFTELGLTPEEARRKFNCGVSAFDSTYLDALAIIEMLRDRLPESRIYAGGPLVSADPDLALKEMFVNMGGAGKEPNALINGWAVKALPAAVRRLDGCDGREELDAGHLDALSGSTGLALSFGGRVTEYDFRQANTLTEEEMNALPFHPEFIWDDAAVYYVPEWECQRNCFYCSKTFPYPLNRPVRMFSAEKIMQDITILSEAVGEHRQRLIDGFQRGVIPLVRLPFGEKRILHFYYTARVMLDMVEGKTEMFIPDNLPEDVTESLIEIMERPERSSELVLSYRRSFAVAGIQGRRERLRFILEEIV
ncbi:MAG: methyltransferase domain-containing protein, partial [Candidatus Omnitrophota bacterium]